MQLSEGAPGTEARVKCHGKAGGEVVRRCCWGSSSPDSGNAVMTQKSCEVVSVCCKHGRMRHRMAPSAKHGHQSHVAAAMTVDT